ncbi:hypothetical protein L9F63_018610, partial [Diploptera punctata]
LRISPFVLSISTSSYSLIDSILRDIANIPQLHFDLCYLIFQMNQDPRRPKVKFHSH